MTIKVTDGDVTMALEAYRETTGCKFWPQCHGMRAALESFIARHPELAPQRAMHEPVSDADVNAMKSAYHRATINDPDPWTLAGNALLARRAAPVREPVVVTEEMFRECRRAILERQATLSCAMGAAMDFALQWLADRINGKHEKPVDPRVEIVRDWAQSHSVEPYDEAIARLLAKLDEVKP